MGNAVEKVGYGGANRDGDKYELLGIDWKAKTVGVPNYLLAAVGALGVYWFGFRKKR